MPIIPMPPRPDDNQRRQRDIERAQREQSAARSLEASSIGEGGLTIKDGGSLTVNGGDVIITDDGTLYVDGDATFNGNLTVPDGTLNTAGNIAAGGDLSAGGTVTGAALVSTGGASVAGTVTAGAISISGAATANTGTFPTGVNSVGVYNTLLTYGGPYAAQWVHSDGTMGYVPSSRRFKQDIDTFPFDPAVSYLRVVTFRYIDAVNRHGEDAEYELGLIAEEVHDLGLIHAVDYKLVYTDEGAQVPVPYQGEMELRPFGVRWDRVMFLLIPWLQSIEARLDAAGI